MRPVKDIIGQRFGSLTVIGAGESACYSSGKSQAKMECRCDCGRMCVRFRTSLMDGRSRHCGCYVESSKYAEGRRNLTGKRFGKLTAIRRILVGKWFKWECLCDCGKTVTRSMSNLVDKAYPSNNCGCVPVNIKKGIASKLWKGHGGISRSVMCQIESSAKNRGIPFDLDKEYLWELFLSQHGRCSLSGIDIKFSSSAKLRLETTASLDRIDSNVGYIRGNVQWTHKWINLMKNDLEMEEFIDFCRAVAKHNSKKKPKPPNELYESSLFSLAA